MAFFRVIQVGILTAVMVMGLSKDLAESAVFIRFDRAPKAASRFTSAVFNYSVVGKDGSNPCKIHGCSFYCELDGQNLKRCPADVIALRDLIPNRNHHFRVNVTTKDGERNSSSYSWFIDTKPPTATISSGQSYTNGEKVAINITFTEACMGKGGFKCINSSNCDVLVSGPAHVNSSSVRIIYPERKYSLDIILSPESIYARINVKMTKMLCTDLAGNQFTQTNGSSFAFHLDRRAVEAELWTSAPSYELEINGALRTVTATNKIEDLKIFLDFSSPVRNSTNEIANAFSLSSGLVIPINSSTHGNRRFVFQLKNVLRTQIIKVELQADSVVSRTGTRVSPVSPVTFLYDCTEPNVWMSTSSPSVTKESYINVVIEFTKPVLGFEASKVEAVGGSLTRFKQLSRALYSLMILPESQNVSVFVPAGKVYDISGNLNSASNQLELHHNSSPAIPIAFHSFISMGILATSLAAAVLSLSSANLEAIGALGSTNMAFSDPSMNLHGMVGHLQVFVLSDWFSDALPVEYTATTKGLRWLIPRAKLSWKRASSSTWPNRLYVAETVNTMNQGIAFPKQTYPHGQQNVTIKSTLNGLPLDFSEYFTYFLRGEPLSASGNIKRLEHYNGWQELEMNLFWLGVGGGSLLLIHILSFLFVRWRTQTASQGILSVPRFELFLLILALPCISQASVFIIRGGTTRGILTGALLLAIPASLILSVCLFLTIAIFSGSFVQYKEIKRICIEEKWYTKLWLLFVGRPTVGKWLNREGLPSSFLSRFGILFDNCKGPPCFVFIEENGPNSTPKWIESGQNGIGRLRAVGSNESNEMTKVPMYKRVVGCARSSYIILDLMRRVTLGILAGIQPSSGRSQGLIALAITLTQLMYLVALKPYIRRGVHVVECVSFLCEAGVFGLSTRINGLDPIKDGYLGHLMLGLLFLTFASQIINEWYNIIECLLRLAHPNQNSFKFGLKRATKGFILPLLPRKHWSESVLESSHLGMGSERQDARTVTAMTATVVPLLSSGSPGITRIQHPRSITMETAHHRHNLERGKRLKGPKLEPSIEMKRLRELARASFSGGPKCEEGSTSYGFR